MAGRTIQVDLQFRADASQAKQQMAALQTSLSQLMTGVNTAQLNIAPQLRQGQIAAGQLKVALNNAFNQNTGKLNLNKFQNQLRQMGTTLPQLSGQLAGLGPAGVKAFSQLTTQIINADTRLFSLEGKAKSLMNTFGSAVKWQIAYGAINQVTQGLSEAVNFAKELDESLNNIRIVTGKSAESMSMFAKQAMNAAKELSISTTEYTDASLIYFQQGLSDSAVKERTDVTVKLANVVSESAETVSEWMTAIWNNFDDGVESLEYYADVLATLGAATASSADEIAGGLEKFAAVADTVGLSYEYAASALATITAETRQSEDVVGTALKTIFARIENLKLGENLEDGTDLGKYSLALQAVGVNIKDANDELRDMDSILDEIGARWATLARDEQVALAQSVAGIRQYSQFIALMDNWDVMQQNLELTEKANGALSEQFRIYEEGVEGAEKRAQVAGEKLKNALFDGDMISGWYEFAEDGLTFVADLVEAFGGLKGILLAVTAILMKMYQPQIANMFSSIAMGGQSLLHAGRSLVSKSYRQEHPLSPQQQVQDDALAANKKMITDAYGANSMSSKVLENRLNFEREALGLNKSLTAEQKQQLDFFRQIFDAQQDELIQSEQQLNIEKQKTKELNDQKVARGAIKSERAAQVLTNVGERIGASQAISTRLLDTTSSAISLTNRNEKVDTNALKESLSSDLNALKKSGQDLLISNQTTEIQNQEGKFLSLGEAINQVEQRMNDYTLDSTKDLQNLNLELETLINNFQNLANKRGEWATQNATPIDKKQQEALNTVDSQLSDNKKVSDQDFLRMTSGNTGGIAGSKLTSSVTLSDGSVKNSKALLANLRRVVKEHAAGVKLQGEDAKLYKDRKKVLKDIIKAEQDTTNAKKKGNKESKESLESSIKNGKSIEENSHKGNKLIQQQNGLFSQLNKGVVSASASLASFASTAASTAMGFSMLYTGIESLANGDWSFSNVLSGITSIMFSLSMLLPLINKVNNANTIATILTNKKAQANFKEALSQKEGVKAKWAYIQATLKEQGVEGVSLLIKGAKILLESYGALAPLVFGAFAIAGVAAAGIAISSGKDKQDKESMQSNMEKSFEQAEQIAETSELRKSVKDLTDEYIRLFKAGNSTKDVLNEMNDTIPDLIEKYKELNKSSKSGDIFNIEELERAYELFKKTGDIETFQRVLDKNDKIASEIAISNYTSAINQALGIARLSQKGSNDGRWNDGGKYKVSIGDADESPDDREEANRILKEVFGDNWAGGTLSFENNSASDFIAGYEQLEKARDELVKAGLGENDRVRELNRELDELKDSYDKVKESIDGVIVELEKMIALEPEKALGATKEAFAGLTLGEIDLEKIKQNVKDWIVSQGLMREDEISDELLTSLIRVDTSVATFSDAEAAVQEGGTIYNQIVNQKEAQMETIYDWFEKLSVEELKVALLLDYTVFNKEIATEEKLQALLNETLERERLSAIELQKQSREEALKDIKVYDEMEKALKDVENELKLVEKAKARAFGDKTQYLKKEIELLNREIELQTQISLVAGEELKRAQEKINQYGFSTNASGQITDRYNSFQRAYDRIYSDSSLSDEAKKTEIDRFKNDVKEYEDLLQKIENAEIEAIELQYEIEERRLKDLQDAVEHDLELTADRMAELEFQMSKIEDDAFAAAEAIAIMGEQAERTVSNMERQIQAIKDVLMMPTANGSSMTSAEVEALLAGDMSILNGKELTQGQVDALREYRDGIYENAQAIEEYADQIKEKVVEAFEAHMEQLERQGELLEHNLSIIESYRNIIDLVGADNLGISDEVLSAMTQAQVSTARAQTEAARIRRDAAKSAYEEAAAADILDEEQLNQLHDAYLDAEEEFMGSWNDALEAAGDAFDTEVERILKKFDDAMGGLEEKMDWFDKLQARNEIFYKDYEKTYEISKLNRQINESLNTIDSVRGQQALQQIQKELLSYQKQGKELSKYDLEYLQKSYDIELARIALEESRNAKSQVRLTRDSAGNFGYVYTADQKAVEKAEQTYEDKIYAMEKFLDESSAAISKQILSWHEAMMEELGELDKNADDYDQKAKTIVDHYMSLINSLSDEGQEILIRGQEMNEKYGTHAAEVFNETIMGKLYTDINSYEEFSRLTQEAISSTLEELEENHQTYQENVSDIFDAAGQDIEDFKDDVVEYLDEIDKKNKEILETTGSMATEMESDFNDVVQKALAFQTKFNNALQPIIEKCIAVADQIDDLIAHYNSIPGAEQIEVLGDNSDRTSIGEEPDNETLPEKQSQKFNIGNVVGGKDGKVYDSDGKEQTKRGNTSFNHRAITDIKEVDGKYYYKVEGSGYYYNQDDLSGYTIPRRPGQQKYTVGGKVAYQGEDGNWYANKSIFDDSIVFANGAIDTSKASKIEEDLVTPQPKEVYLFPNDTMKQFALFNKYERTNHDTFQRDWLLTQYNGSDLTNGNSNVIEFSNEKDGYIFVDKVGGWIKVDERIQKGFILDSFDTGGYTGTWGPEGRLAMLHQKEIVLNAHDTENFLAAIGIVRDISDQIEKNAVVMQYENKLNSLKAALSRDKDTLQQNVYITAEFPNATNHTEIEEAFKNLSNLASQYANRK